VLGADDELAAVEPVIHSAGLGLGRYRIDPPTLDVEHIVLDEELAERVTGCALALVLADVSGDDRLPLISFVDESLPPSCPLLVSCVQAGATEQAAICQHAERVVGIGMLGLLSGKRIAEVAATANTDPDILAAATSFLQSGGVAVTPVLDVPGLVLARLLVPLVNEAVFALADGSGTVETIDAALSLGANFPFGGPLRWADTVGLDRLLLAMEYLVQATREERYRPAPLLRRMAQAGHTGKVAGRGFYHYEEEEQEQ
jgi:3-hydroxybutyryl-CoA dehydrogenase